MSVLYRFSLLLLSTVACTYSAVQAYQRWIVCGYFAVVRAPYTTEQFTQMIIFFVTAPLALGLSLIVSRSMLRIPFQIGHVVSIALSAVVVALSVKYNVTYNNCGVFNCYNTGSRTIENPPNSNRNAIGFASTVMSLIFVIVCMFMITIGLLVLQNMFTYLKSKYIASYKQGKTSLNASLLETENTQDAVLPTHVDKPAVLPQKEHLIPVVLHFVFFTLTTLIYYYVSMNMSNLWRKFTPWNLADIHAIDLTQEAAKCKVGPEMCPERPEAFFTTFYIKLAEQYKLKSFPSLTLLFMFLLSMAVLGILMSIARAYKSKIFQKEFRFTTKWSIFGFFLDKNKRNGTYRMYTDVLQLVLFTMFSVFITAFTYYWQHDHNYKTKWPRFEMQTLEVSMRTAGSVATVIMALLLFPVSKTSHVLKILNLSYETSLQYHRILGIFCLIAMIIHAVTAWVLILQRNSLQSFFAVPAIFKFSLDKINDWTVPLMNYATLFSIITLTFAAIPYCRRNFYRVFLYSHYITYMVLIPATIFHASGAIQYFIPALFVYIIDFCFQTYRRAQYASLAIASKDSSDFYSMEQDAPVGHKKAVAIHDYGTAGRYIVMDIVKPGFQYKAGQYVYVNIAEASLVEWHPYTIASCEKQGDTHQFTLYIKVSEKKFSWTQALYTYIKEKSYHAKFDLTVSIDGPYAETVDYADYDRVVLLGGGAGITPCISIYETLQNIHNSALHDSTNAKYRDMQVNLLFVAKDPALFNVLRNRYQITEHFYIDLYCANTEKVQESEWRDEVKCMRPDVTEYLTEIASSVRPNQRVLVFVCGPVDIQIEAHDFCHSRPNYTFHTETFDF